MHKNDGPSPPALYDQSLIIRDSQFSADEEHLIDILDVKVCTCIASFHFGCGYITIKHVSMLFRNHQSLNKLSNQGFGAAYKLQRQLYIKATSHDAADSISSGKVTVIDASQPSKLYCTRMTVFSPYQPAKRSFPIPCLTVV